MTPEQEEQVRRALASAPPESAMPPEVAARLDAALAGLVAERSARPDHEQDTGPEPAAAVALEERRRRRWPRVLVAAASVSLLAYGAGIALSGGADARARRTCSSCSGVTAAHLLVVRLRGPTRAQVVTGGCGWDARACLGVPRRGEPGEQGKQPGTAARAPALHRPRSALEDRGRLLDGVALHVHEHERRSLVGREGVERGEDGGAPLVVHRDVRGSTLTADVVDPRSAWSSRSSGSGSASRTLRRLSRSRQALTTIRCSQVVTAASPR